MRVISFEKRKRGTPFELPEADSTSADRGSTVKHIRGSSGQIRFSKISTNAHKFTTAANILLREFPATATLSSISAVDSLQQHGSGDGTVHCLENLEREKRNATATEDPARRANKAPSSSSASLLTAPSQQHAVRPVAPR